MSYTDKTTSSKYPKTLIIRNHLGGMIWQVYHVEREIEADKLASTATSNGFQAITLENYQPEHEQTWPDWRENCPWLDEEE